MARLTIAEKRERELSRLVAYKTNNPTPEDWKEARRMMNSFYRLCALDYRVCELENDAATANKSSTRRASDRAYNWYKRLDADFRRVYGLFLEYSGVCPHIVKKQGGADAVERFFYD